jgi:hypothetical protein
VEVISIYDTVSDVKKIVLRVVTTYDILDSGICTGTEGNDTDNESQNASTAHEHVLLGEPLTLTEQGKPHDTGDPERETGDEEGGSQREQVGKDGNGLSNDPGDNGEDGHESDPADPTHGSVDISQN